MNMLKSFLIVSILGVVLLSMFSGCLGPRSIEIGDCADIQYVARFASNGTIFDSSYENPELKTGGDIYKVFVNPNLDLTIPNGYEGYSAAQPYGFLNGLVGLQEGEIVNVTVPPEDAYGIWNETALMELFNLSYGIPYFPRNTFYPFTENLTKNALETAFQTSPITDIDIESIQEGDRYIFRNGTLPTGEPASWDIEIQNITDSHVIIQHHVVNNTIIPPIEGISLWNTSIIVINQTLFYERADPEIGMTISNAEGIMGQPVHMKVIDTDKDGIYLAMNTKAPAASLVGQSIQYTFEIITVYDTAPQDT